MADVLQPFDDARLPPDKASLVVLRTTRSLAENLPTLRELTGPLEERVHNTTQPKEPQQ